MNIYYVLYELEANQTLSATCAALKRQGALLKVCLTPDKIGYADCHPWTERGDLSLQQQLTHLAQGKLTPLTQYALKLATLDAEKRSQGKGIFLNQQIPLSHFLITNVFEWTPQHISHLIQQGYTHVKLKVGRHPDREAEILHSLFFHTPLQLRLDFNETLTPQTFRHFLQGIQQLQHQIDFIEDPFPFDSQEWTAIQKEGWILACDSQASRACDQPEAAQILIVKPALQPCEEWQKWIHQSRIVTSYLGHPLEQVAAAYVASQIDPSCASVHGLLSHHAYQPTLFSQRLSWQSPHFILPPGTGFGFDQELEALHWIPLHKEVFDR
jgi:O-succinylbenzoate synthase